MGTSDGLGAGCARSLRCSFSAWALRILATISGLVFVGGGAGIFFFALGGADSTTLLTAEATVGVVAFTDFAALSSDLEGSLGACFPDGLGDEWILVGFTTAASATSFSFLLGVLVVFVAATDFVVCLLGLAAGFAEGFAATVGFFVFGAI